MQSTSSRKLQNPSRILPFHAAFIIALLLPLHIAQGQVNTEAMRRDNLAPGLHHRIGIDLEFQDGNTNFLSFGAGYRLDLLAGDFSSFLITRYDRRSTGDVLSRNEGFAHLRFIYLLDSTFRPEVFAQKEFNDFILLRDRNLIGGGLRIRALALQDSSSRLTLFVGIGGIYETEDITTTPEERTRLFRSTNYISLQAKLGPILTGTLTGYYQIAPSRAEDFRVLAEGELSMRISDVFSFNLTTRYRYDNLPPAGLEKFDFRISNGVGVAF